MPTMEMTWQERENWRDEQVKAAREERIKYLQQQIQIWKDADLRHYFKGSAALRADFVACCEGRLASTQAGHHMWDMGSISYDRRRYYGIPNG